MSIESDFERNARSDAQEYVKELAIQLRNIADRVEREAPSMLTPRYMSGVSTVIHEVVWGIANLGLDSLVKRTDDITVAIEQGLKRSINAGSPIQKVEKKK